MQSYFSDLLGKAFGKYIVLKIEKQDESDYYLAFMLLKDVSEVRQLYKIKVNKKDFENLGHNFDCYVAEYSVDTGDEVVAIFDFGRIYCVDYNAPYDYDFGRW